jgi:RluA family pseudouridine synthase
LPRCWLTTKREQGSEISFDVRGLAEPARLDVLLRRRFPEWGRQAVQRLIAARHVQVNGKRVWLASWQVRNGDRIQITEAPAPKPSPISQWDERWLLTADEHLVALNKPSGLPSEAPPMRSAPSLHALAVERFGPLILLHRLDRDTSGVLLLARTAEANRVVSTAWQQRKVEKEYVAVVAAPNQLAEEGVIGLRLAPDPRHRERMVVVAKGGQGAVTRYRVAAGAHNRQLVLLWPATGRTHQLRVHLAALRAPILGDRLYGDEQSAPRLLLHARRLLLPPLPWAGEHSFTAPMPQEFALEGVEPEVLLQTYWIDGH